MSCTTCGESRFANFAQLGCHICKNHAEISCSCNKKFMDEESLRRHEQDMQKNSKEFRCSRCCRSFRTASALHQHKRSTNHWAPGERERVQKEIGRVFCDDRCGRIFKTVCDYMHHRRDIFAKYGGSDMMCRVCEKSFLNKERLYQHQKDTGHSNKQSRVKEYLNNFHKNKIAMSKDDKRESVEIVEDTLRSVMGRINKLDGGDIYCPNVVKAGSYPVKTKIGQADEFDTNVVCNVTPVNVFTRGKIYYAYEPLGRQMGSSNNMNIPMQLKDKPEGKTIPTGYAAVKVDTDYVPAKLTHNGYLIPREVKRDLYDKVKSVIEDLGLKNVDLNRNAHGPAITITIHLGSGHHDISVDITPSLPCDVLITDNGWPRPDTRKAFKADVIERVKKTGLHLVPKGNELWAVSYSKAEKLLLSKIDEGNGCRREVNRIMKKHVQICSSGTKHGLPGVSSHIIKVLWSAEKYPDQEYWHHGNIHNCLIDIMGDMATALCKGKLPDYFNTSQNILKDKDRDVLRQLGNYFKEEKTQLLHM